MDVHQSTSGSKEELQVTHMKRWEGDKEETDSQMGLSAVVDLADPAQARAYVEGFRMGQLASSQGTNGTSSRERENVLRHGRSHSRSDSLSQSRSPKRSRSDVHRRPSESSARGSKNRRGKSPLRYYDGSRHNPTLPSTDRYRPGPATALEKEDSYGRLKMDDFSCKG